MTSETGKKAEEPFQPPTYPAAPRARSHPTGAGGRDGYQLVIHFLSRSQGHQSPFDNLDQARGLLQRTRRILLRRRRLTRPPIHYAPDMEIRVRIGCRSHHCDQSGRNPDRYSAVSRSDSASDPSWLVAVEFFGGTRYWSGSRWVGQSWSAERVIFRLPSTAPPEIHPKLSKIGLNQLFGIKNQL